MAQYTKATNFTAKDGLPANNSGKIVKGAEIDTEFNAIAAAIASKADSNSPTLTGTPLAPTAAAGTSNTQIATTAFANGVIPSGVIVMWSGSIATIPSGWYLCNGSNSTPDLRNRFIVGAGSTYSVAGTGGSADAITVAHTHTGTTASNGSHEHLMVADTTNFSGTSPWGGGTYLAQAGSFGDSTYRLRGTDAASPTVAQSSSAGAHTHTFTTGSTGSSGTNANLPPYYALAYIMKA
jgi:hypothetical protein